MTHRRLGAYMLDVGLAFGYRLPDRGRGGGMGAQVPQGVASHFTEVKGQRMHYLDA